MLNTFKLKSSNSVIINCFFSCNWWWKYFRSEPSRFLPISVLIGEDVYEVKSKLTFQRSWNPEFSWLPLADKPRLYAARQMRLNMTIIIIISNSWPMCPKFIHWKTLQFSTSLDLGPWQEPQCNFKTFCLHSMNLDDTGGFTGVEKVEGLSTGF